MKERLYRILIYKTPEFIYAGCDISFLILDVFPLSDYSIKETIIRHYSLRRTSTCLYFNEEKNIVNINSYLKETYYDKNFFDIKRFISDVKTPNVSVAAYMTSDEKSAITLLRSLPIYLHKTKFGTIFQLNLIPQYRKEVMKLQRNIKDINQP